MHSRLPELFEDQKLCEEIRVKLPQLFHLAELQVCRGGRIGMEVGILREQILIALLMHKFGLDSVEIPPTREAEVDVYLYKYPISIKTISCRSPLTLPSVKLTWTVDWKKVDEFINSYTPKCDILLTIVCWGFNGGLYAIPLSVQQRIFKHLGRDRYLSKARRGTNPRGVSLSRKALTALLNHPDTRGIKITWERSSRYEKDSLWPYERWLYYWKGEGP